MNFSKAQKQFLLDNFSLNASDFKTMSDKDWENIKRECLVIEGIEYEKAEKNQIAVSDKGKIAEQLVDLLY